MKTSRTDGEMLTPVVKHARRRLWLHPILFAIYPALSLLAANADQVPLTPGLRITLAALLAGILVYAAARLAVRRDDAAALVASVTLLASLSYGRLYDGLKDLGLSGETLVRHRYLLPAYAAVLGAGIFWCARRRGWRGLESGGAPAAGSVVERLELKRESPLLEAYSDQVTFLNKRLLQDIETILAESDPQPIIILMGDHGWADRNIEDRLSILNTYLVPPAAAARLDQTITPVNSSRVIFDAVYGGSYRQLPNVSYISTEAEESEFAIVPNTWASSMP
jgi:hypothetical protein